MGNKVGSMRLHYIYSGQDNHATIMEIAMGTCSPSSDPVKPGYMSCSKHLWWKNHCHLHGDRTVVMPVIFLDPEIGNGAEELSGRMDETFAIGWAEVGRQSRESWGAVHCLDEDSDWTEILGTS